MSPWSRVRNLWKLSGIDLSEVEVRVERVKRRAKEAKIVEMQDILDQFEI